MDPKISEEINVADAHPSGKRPFEENNTLRNLKFLTEGLITRKETKDFLNLVQNLKKLKTQI